MCAKRNWRCSFGVFSRPLVQINTQFEWSVRGEFLGPAYDEFFCVVVQILRNERRRVHRIEKLGHFAQFQTYDVRTWRQFLVKKKRI